MRASVRRDFRPVSPVFVKNHSGQPTLFTSRGYSPRFAPIDCERSRFFTHVGLRGWDGGLAGWDGGLAACPGWGRLGKPSVAADRRTTVDVHSHLEPARAKLAERS